MKISFTQGENDFNRIGRRKYSRQYNWHPCPWQTGWRQMIFNVPSNPTNSIILSYKYFNSRVLKVNRHLMTCAWIFWITLSLIWIKVKHFKEHQTSRIWFTKWFVHHQSRAGSRHTLGVAGRKGIPDGIFCSVLQSRVLPNIHLWELNHVDDIKES